MRAEIKSELDAMVTDQEMQTHPKRALLTSILEQATDFLQSEGYDIRNFHLTGDIQDMLFLPNDTLVAYFMSEPDIRVLDTVPYVTDLSGVADENVDGNYSRIFRGPDDLPDGYCCIGHFTPMEDDETNLSIQWAMIKREDGKNFALVNGVLTPHYAFEHNGLVNCDLCPHRLSCGSYGNRLVEDSTKTIQNTEFTEQQREDADDRTSLADLLASVALHQGAVTDSEWEEIKYAHMPLLDLLDACDGLLTFTCDANGYVLTTANPGLAGFMIRYIRGEYRLYQYLEAGDLAEAFDTDYTGDSYIKLVGKSKKMSDMQYFVMIHGDRMAMNDSMAYSIPVSIIHAIRYRGVMTKEYIKNSKAFFVKAQKAQNNLGWTKDEIKNAIAFFNMAGREAKPEQPMYKVLGDTEEPLPTKDSSAVSDPRSF